RVRGRRQSRPPAGGPGGPCGGRPAGNGDGRADAPRARARCAVGALIRAVLASANENKLRELGHALDAWSLELLDAQEYPPESGDTFLENARAKARLGRTLTSDPWVLGEGSGVEIDGIGDGPGVRSARWAAG